MNCYEIIETHRTNRTVNVLAELHCEEEKIKAEFARWAAWLDEENNTKAGDECFSVEEGICKIMHSNTDNLIAAMNKSGGWDAFTKDGKLEPESTHPLLFNSFAQFKAYWAEQALLMAPQRRNHE